MIHGEIKDFLSIQTEKDKSTTVPKIKIEQNRLVKIYYTHEQKLYSKPQIFQGNELPLLRNPALAGTYRGDVRVTTAFRNQWNSVTVPYKTEALGTELKFGVSQNSNDYLSLGLQITNDIAGDSKTGQDTNTSAACFS